MNDRPQRSAQAQFGRTADRYRVSRTHSDNNHLVDLAEFAGFTDERFDVAVDIGAGPGFTAFAMAPFAAGSSPPTSRHRCWNRSAHCATSAAPTAPRWR